MKASVVRARFDVVRTDTCRGDVVNVNATARWL